MLPIGRATLLAMIGAAMIGPAPKNGTTNAMATIMRTNAVVE